MTSDLHPLRGSLSPPKPVFSVPVRDLVEFAWRSGDLGGSGDFIGSDRALAGIRGHQRIQRARPAAYQKEVAVSYEIATDELTLRVAGRIDGVLITAGEVLIEEIKTVRGSWDGVTDPLHWAQAKIYGFIYAHDHGADRITIQLTYLNLETADVTEFRESFARADLASFFEQTTTLYLEWIRELHRWRGARDESIRRLAFPFPNYRAGQRELAVAVYHTLAAGGRLFVEAPTGIGKTISVLFPALKALAEGKLEQIFYLTARTIGRTVAEKAFVDLQQAGARLRVLTLTAKEKLCARDGHPCDLATCPLAIGYYDRRKPAMRDALKREMITRPVLETVSREYQVCPFELSLDLSLWVDAVVCDYNYAFDPQAFLRRHFAEPNRRYGFFVDEAHNLVDRAREMFSADLQTGEIDQTKRAVKDAVPRCAKMLSKLARTMRKLSGPIADERDSSTEFSFGQSETPDASPNFTEQRGGVLTSRMLPAQLLPLIEDSLKEAEIWLARNQPAAFREDLLQLYFRLHAFRRTAEVYSEDYVTIVQPGPTVRVRLFCLNPSSRLRHACDRARAVVFFSGTLTPLEYYRDLLGGAVNDRVLQLQSPFAPENLAVLVHDRVRTNLKARAETLPQVVELISALVQGRRGNYLVYFPSYQYLQAGKELFERLHLGVSTLEQRPGMTEAEREAFLAAFASDHGETLVGFAVLGGIFGEGIDLVGERLIGVIIAGVGLPQLCAERDLIRDYFQEKRGSGFDYAYTFPGMNRVLQASGRVIRSETDRGFVALIDSRFTEARYRGLFPPWWRVACVRDVEKIRDAIVEFWAD
jgi:DNA excision repair protein ERCC-2